MGKHIQAIYPRPLKSTRSRAGGENCSCLVGMWYHDYLCSFCAACTSVTGAATAATIHIAAAVTGTTDFAAAAYTFTCTAAGAARQITRRSARTKQAKAIRRSEKKEAQEINEFTTGLAGLNTPGLGPVPSMVEGAGIRLTAYFQAHRE